MGKLGGGELNFSSDIDLILLYPEDGETDGARAIDNAEFFLRLGQKVVQLLATPTVEGFVYRVDLRLRPFGDSGRVALSFASFEHYLQEHGRDWERYAYVKARPLTAIEHHAELYDEVLRPFVYRRYLDYSVFESLREMKGMISREVERRELQDNIKLGPGGIREIEFIVQSFQLMRGGSDRRLQSRELRTVLPLLVGQRFLRREAVTELDAAYRYLRVVENRLQQWNDEQTHQLPEDEIGRERLALRDGRERLECVERGARAASSAGRAAFRADGFRSGHGRSNGTGKARGAGRHGCHRHWISCATLLTTAGWTKPGGADCTSCSGDCCRSLRSPSRPTTTLVRVLKILERIGGRTVYLALLNENAAALRRLVTLCEQSQFLADQISAQPLLLDELIDERLIEATPTRTDFTEELALRRQNMQNEEPERQVELLREFQSAALFRVAVADLIGRLPLMKVSDRLTDIAELLVQETLVLARSQMEARHGVPRYTDASGTAASRT